MKRPSPPRDQVTRRALMGGAATLMFACRRTDAEAEGHHPAESRAAPSTSAATLPEPIVGGLDFEEIDLDFPSSPVGAEKAMVVIPRWGDAADRYPVLVALHGRGESVRGVDIGAHGWVHDYELARTFARLRSPPLTRDDFRGFVDPERLARINASLVDRPFRGLIVVCPWVPDVLSDRDRANLDAAEPFSQFVIDQLLPRVLAETPALVDPSATGIDGVSLGGRVALVTGLSRVARFGAIGTLQAAIQESEAAALTDRARWALPDGGGHKLRLLTSDRDYFRGAIARLHASLDEARIGHEYLVIPGGHDYTFNRGPGGIEMLLWHDRVLRGEAPL